MWLLGASQFLFLGQNGSRWHNPSPGVQALLISVCHGEKDTWPKAHLDTTSNHAPWNSEPKSCAWRVPKHWAQNTKHKPWHGKSDQDGTTLQQVSRPYLSQYAMVKGHLRPWDDPKHTWTPPRTMLLGTVNPSHVPEGCQKHRAQNTTHSLADLNCQKLHLEKLRSEIKNSPVDVAPKVLANFFCSLDKMDQDGTTLHQVSRPYLSQYAMVKRTPETVEWPKAHLDTTSNHAPWNSEPKSCAWRVPKTQSTKHTAQPTAWQIWTAKNFTWRNYVRKSRIARLMWLLGASQFLFLGQDGSRWHNPSPGVQALLISVCHGERTPETVGWPKAHLDTTSNHAPWNSEPKSCAWRVPKTQSTKHTAQPTAWQIWTAKNFTWRNYVRKSRIARLMWLLGASRVSVPWTRWIKMAQPFTRCPGPTYLSMPWWKDTWDRGMTQSTLGHHLEPCSLEQWTQVMCLKGAKTLSTKHKAHTMAWQIWSRWHNPSTGVQALLISVCNGEIDTWDRGMTQSTLGHHIEPCSLEQWAQVMCPKGAKNTKHNTQPTAWQIWTAKNFTWRNYVRKSRIARLMWLRGARLFLFLDKMDQDGTTLQQVSRPYLSQYAMVKGHLRPWDDPKHNWNLGTVSFTWRNYVRKSRIARYWCGS